MLERNMFHLVDRAELDDLAIACYEVALRRGRFVDEEIATELDARRGDVTTARETLQDLHLVIPGSSGGPPVPTAPDAAEAALTIPIERDIANSREAVARIRRELRSLAPIYLKRAQAPDVPVAVRVVNDPGEVLRLLDLHSASCQREVFTMQPGGGRRPDTLQSALVRDLSMLERGVAMRILYQHTARASLATRQYVRQVSEAGAEVRTVAEINDRLIIFDQRIAFVPQPRRDGRAPGALVITEPNVVSYLCRAHDNTWLAGEPFDPDSVNYEETSSAIQNSILQLMSLGLKDEAIARRLGMATGTCRRYIASIIESLGATSRFQAGVRATQLGLLDDHPEDSMTDREQL